MTLDSLYARYNGSLIWVGPDQHRRDDLLRCIETAARRGLSEEDYLTDRQRSLLKDSITLVKWTDSLQADLTISDMAIHFFEDIRNGNYPPSLGYVAPDLQVHRVHPVDELLNAIQLQQLPSLADRLESTLPQARTILMRLALILDRKNTGPTESMVKSNTVSITNKPLLHKLYLLGALDTIQPSTDSTVRHSLQQAQREFNLLADGSLRSTTMEAINVPLSARLEQLRTALNDYRWLGNLITREPAVVVNIPATDLKVLDKERVLLEMHIIAGKPSTKTPTLLSRITEVILYPYWSVPKSIATKELLPIIQRHPSYLESNNFQVINSLGRVVDPSGIDWSSLSAAYFPYTIRQSTGCDNSLGLLKLNFYSPFGVYLHDTPNKGLFVFNKRFFSHGCMRMESPMELGHLLLPKNSIAIDTLEEKGCLQHQSPVVVKADWPLPVLVWYNLVDLNKSGELVFYEDVYKYFGRRKK